MSPNASHVLTEVNISLLITVIKWARARGQAAAAARAGGPHTNSCRTNAVSPQTFTHGLVTAEHDGCCVLATPARASCVKVSGSNTRVRLWACKHAADSMSFTMTYHAYFAVPRKASRGANSHCEICHDPNVYDPYLTRARAKEPKKCFPTWLLREAMLPVRLLHDYKMNVFTGGRGVSLWYLVLPVNSYCGMFTILRWFVTQLNYSSWAPLLQHITLFHPPSPPSLSRACVCAACQWLASARWRLARRVGARKWRAH